MMMTALMLGGDIKGGVDNARPGEREEEKGTSAPSLALVLIDEGEFSFWVTI